jgi:hypothetical protein
MATAYDKACFGRYNMRITFSIIITLGNPISNRSISLKSEKSLMVASPVERSYHTLIRGFLLFS